MLSLISAILEDPYKGLLIACCIGNLYLWKEINKLEAKLDAAKLDKSTFHEYEKNHGIEHKNHVNYFKMIIELIKGKKEE